MQDPLCTVQCKLPLSVCFYDAFQLSFLSTYVFFFWGGGGVEDCSGRAEMVLAGSEEY
jgi:hypothetical protein